MKKIMILSHCVLNSFCESPQAPESYRKDIVDCALNKGISLLQLPCPELSYQGLQRNSIYPGTKESVRFEEYCKELLIPIISNLKEYAKDNVKISAIIGIDTSPSCSVIDKKAIMMSLLLAEVARLGFTEVKCVDMPVVEGYKKFIDELEQI